jgi:hypothetical protein
MDLREAELPFWGEFTNGGLADNNMRFSPGKAFMQSLLPMVAFKETSRPFRVVGVLTEIVQLFKDHMERAVRLFSKLGYETYMRDKMSRIEIF